MNHADSQTRLRPQLPQRPEEQDILRLRAQQMAQSKKKPLTSTTQAQLLHFRLDSETHYGIAYRFIEEIIPVGTLTPIPQTPPIITGIINHHGELLTIIDLTCWLTEIPTIINSSTRILVVRGAGIKAGILISAIEGNIRYQPDNLTPSLQLSSLQTHAIIEGIHAGEMVILNIDALLSHPRLAIGDQKTHNKPRKTRSV